MKVLLWHNEKKMFTIELCHKLLWIKFCVVAQHIRFTPKENTTGNYIYNYDYRFCFRVKNPLKDFSWDGNVLFLPSAAYVRLTLLHVLSLVVLSLATSQDKKNKTITKLSVPRGREGTMVSFKAVTAGFKRIKRKEINRGIAR